VKRKPVEDRSSQNVAPSANGRALPKGWRMVRFGEVVRDVNAAERNPLAAGLERFVGLEHIESDNLHLKQWGLLADGEISFTKRFRRGQVLFGKRRAYQRKVAVAEFDGICSSDILTFEPKGDTLIPELLPFIVQSDGFFEHALGTSSGSLSPRTRWSQLQNYEFPLPPKDEQCRIAELLRSADDAVDTMARVCEDLRLTRNTAHQELFDAVRQSHLWNNSWDIKPISAVCEIANNLRKPINAAERAEIPGPFPYYGPTGVLDHINEYRVEGEYVLIGEDGDHFLKFLDWDMTQLVSGKFNVNNHAHIIRGRDACRTRWVFHYFKHRDIRGYLARQGAGRLKLKKATLEEMCLPVPPLVVQDRIISELEALDTGLSAAKAHWTTLRELATSIREVSLRTRKEE